MTLSANGAGQSVSRTVSATDGRAGNTASVTGSYRTLSIYLEGARYRNGAFEVTAGRSYTMVVFAGGRPQYYDAAVFPQRPTKPDNKFRAAGRGRWTLGVRMQLWLESHEHWNLGVKIGRTIYTIKIKVS